MGPSVAPPTRNAGSRLPASRPCPCQAQLSRGLTQGRPGSRCAACLPQRQPGGGPSQAAGLPWAGRRTLPQPWGRRRPAGWKGSRTRGGTEEPERDRSCIVPASSHSGPPFPWLQGRKRREDPEPQPPRSLSRAAPSPAASCCWGPRWWQCRARDTGGVLGVPQELSAELPTLRKPRPWVEIGLDILGGTFQPIPYPPTAIGHSTLSYGLAEGPRASAPSSVFSLCGG